MFISESIVGATSTMRPTVDYVIFSEHGIDHYEGTGAVVCETEGVPSSVKPLSIRP
jgi:hypothetical protein